MLLDNILLLQVPLESISDWHLWDTNQQLHKFDWLVPVLLDQSACLYNLEITSDSPNVLLWQCWNHTTCACASWTDSNRCSSATGGSTTMSHHSSMIFSTGCQSHSASSTSSVYLFFYHFTELLQSTCAFAALGLIPPHLDCGCNRLRGSISKCGRWRRTMTIVLSQPLVLDAGIVALLLFVWLTQWTHSKPCLKLNCSLRLTLFSCLWGALVAVRLRYGAIKIVVIIITVMGRS